MKAEANSAKHSSLATNTGYAPASGATISAASSKPYRMNLKEDEWFMLAASLVSYFSLPNRPAGRTSSTSAMITNTTVDEACG